MILGFSGAILKRYINLTPCVPLSLRGWEKERGREFERGWRPSRWDYSPFMGKWQD
jgi:hypothetical protein